MTSKRFTTIAGLLAAAVLAASIAIAAPPRADASGGDDVVAAVNTKDGRFLYRVRLSIKRVTGDVVDNANVAAAAASCDSCETVAVSIQGLLLFSDPSVFTPTNFALAANVGCSFCDTLASAYQFAIQAGRPVHLTADGNRDVAQIRHQLEAIRHEGLTIFEIQAQVDALAQQLLGVLLTEVVGPPA